MYGYLFARTTFHDCIHELQAHGHNAGISGACTVVAVLASVASLLVEGGSGDGDVKEQVSDDGLSVASKKQLEICIL